MFQKKFLIKNHSKYNHLKIKSFNKKTLNQIEFFYKKLISYLGLIILKTIKITLLKKFFLIKLESFSSINFCSFYTSFKNNLLEKNVFNLQKTLIPLSLLKRYRDYIFFKIFFFKCFKYFYSNKHFFFYGKRKFKRWTVLKSPHTDKKSREQLEMITLNRNLKTPSFFAKELFDLFFFYSGKDNIFKYSYINKHGM